MQLSRDARARSGESPAMPTFLVVRFHVDDDTGAYDMYEVTCPRCRQPFWVRLLWMVKKVAEDQKPSDRRRIIYKTRPCPYCFKTSKLPKKSKIKRR